MTKTFASPPVPAADIDRIVGSNLRALREASGLSRRAVEERLSLGRGALARMEGGKSTLPAGDLWQLAKLFRVPTERLFAGLDLSPAPADPEGLNADHVERLVTHFVAIDDARIRRSILALARAAAEAGPSET